MSLIEIFEQSFEALAAKFNCHSDKDPMLPDSLVAFLLMADAKLDDSQRISILAAASPKDSSLDSSSATSEFLKSLTYEAILSAIRQFDKPREIKDTSASSVIQVSSARAHGAWKPHGKQRLRREQLADLKFKSKCYKCKKKGHWAKECTKDSPSSFSNHDNDISETIRRFVLTWLSLRIEMTIYFMALDQFWTMVHLIVVWDLRNSS